MSDAMIGGREQRVSKPSIFARIKALLAMPQELQRLTNQNMQLRAQIARLEEEKVDKILEWMGVLLKSELDRVSNERLLHAQPRRTLY